MPRFFTSDVNEEQGVISGPDAKHIAKVLRMKTGESLTVCDGCGWDYLCRIESVQESEILLRVEQKELCRTEPSVFVRLYQAMPKADKFDLIIQKAVELGVSEIIPVQTHRCVSRPDAKSMAKKLERYNRIAYEAAKQCGRGKIPAVLPMLDFTPAITQIAEADCPILFYENSTTSMKQLLENQNQNQNKNISILVGAEGGFEKEEVQAAQEMGIHILSLGERILRCETAPLAALAVIMYQTGNLG